MRVLPGLIIVPLLVVPNLDKQTTDKGERQANPFNHSKAIFCTVQMERFQTLLVYIFLPLLNCFYRQLFLHFIFSISQTKVHTKSKWYHSYFWAWWATDSQAES